MEIAKMLVLSTAHLTEDTCNNYLHDCEIVAYEKGDYGWFVWVGNNCGSRPADLEACLDFASGQGCQWVMFDRDGPEIDDLPTYEW